MKPGRQLIAGLAAGLAALSGACGGSAIEPHAGASTLLEATVSAPVDAWRRVPLPAVLGSGCGLATLASGELVALSAEAMARSGDGGQTWAVAPLAVSETRYTNSGAAPYVDRGGIDRPWYAHGPLEGSPPVASVALVGPNALVFHLGTFSTAVSIVPLAGVYGTPSRTVYLSKGGSVDGLGYDGPRRAALAGEPVLVGQVYGRATIYASSDEGRTWEPRWRGEPDGPRIAAISGVSDSEGYLVLSDGTLEHSTDALLSWQVSGSVPAAIARDVSAMNVTEAGAIVVLGSRGRGAISRDRGRSWATIDLPVRAEIFDVASSGDLVWAVGAGGAVLESRDGGSTFRQVDLPAGASGRQVHVRDGRAWIVLGDAIYVSPGVGR